MKGLLLSLLASAAGTPGHPVTSVTPQRATMAAMPTDIEWVFNGQVDTTCELQTEGEVTTLGASVNLDCAAGTQLVGNLQASVPAQGWRQRRVTISAEIKAADAMSASLWLKTQQRTRTLMFDDATEQDLLSDVTTEDGWVRRTVTLPVAADATQISFGVLLQGIDRVALRDVQMTVSEPGMIAPDAAHLLDSAISIVKQQTQARNDLAWQVLEPQLRLFASGAQSSSDVYPAIKYLLSRLGDRQSLLLTPDVAAALRQFGAASAESPSTGVNVFSLPDGACLVLSSATTERALRTAQNIVPAVSAPVFP
jgi:hypothetical protein